LAAIAAIEESGSSGGKQMDVAPRNANTLAVAAL
jgi:hypothetical protein